MQEKSILSEEFGFKISEENQEGKYRIDQRTVVFLPHSPHELVNNLLRTNWNPKSLKSCYILSNSLCSVTLSSLSLTDEDNNLSFICKAQSICTEIPIPNEFKENSKAFNELSLHFFPVEKLKNL